MAGSTFGKCFTITTWGESHGAALGVVIDGCPANLSLTESDIQRYLDRRKPGQSAITTQRKEADQVKILSGEEIYPEHEYEEDDIDHVYYKIMSYDGTRWNDNRWEE